MDLPERVLRGCVTSRMVEYRYIKKLVTLLINIKDLLFQFDFRD